MNAFFDRPREAKHQVLRARDNAWGYYDLLGNVAEWDTADPMHPGAATTEAVLTFDNGVRGAWTSGRCSPMTGDPATV